jgi:hypothetical protein
MIRNSRELMTLKTLVVRNIGLVYKNGEEHGHFKSSKLTGGEDTVYIQLHRLLIPRTAPCAADAEGVHHTTLGKEGVDPGVVADTGLVRLSVGEDLFHINDGIDYASSLASFSGQSSTLPITMEAIFAAEQTQGAHSQVHENSVYEYLQLYILTPGVTLLGGFFSPSFNSLSLYVCHCFTTNPSFFYSAS